MFVRRVRFTCSPSRRTLLDRCMLWSKRSSLTSSSCWWPSWGSRALCGLGTLSRMRVANDFGGSCLHHACVVCPDRHTQLARQTGAAHRLFCSLLTSIARLSTHTGALTSGRVEAQPERDRVCGVFRRGAPHSTHHNNVVATDVPSGGRRRRCFVPTGFFAPHLPLETSARQQRKLYRTRCVCPSLR